MKRWKVYLCAAVFLLLTAVKMIAPAAAADARKVLLPAINADDDYKSVFAEIRSVFAPAPVQTQDEQLRQYLPAVNMSVWSTPAPEPTPTPTPEPTPEPTPTPTPEPTPEPLVPYEGEIRHIFFHSLIVYPEMVFTDRETPMGGYNAGFSEKAELEKILPQLYERGYVLYDLNECYEMADGRMQRKEILLPAGKIPLILSVDDVAYAYGDGYARRLFVDDAGALLYEVPNPSGGVDIIADGDVMGVVDAFVAEHPDFSWNGHKGTIALTGFQGAFGYPSYDDPAYQTEIKKVADALRADGWSFASHSYTHNSGVYGFWGTGCIPDKIYYDINKWVDRVSPWIGETNLFLAPFGYRATGEALQHVLNAGFNIYCTVDDHVVNELYDNYALQSRIEIGGYSMTYYRDILNELFFDVDSVLDPDRPPVVYDE